MLTVMNSVPLVADLMTENIEVLSPEHSLKDLELFFRSKHFRHVPILKKNKLVGIVSRTDFDKITVGLGLAGKSALEIENLLVSTTISKLMTQEVVTVTPETTVEEVMKIFREQDFHALPVIDGDNVVGIISHHDVFYYL